VTAFVEGPDSYLTAQRITFPSAVDPSQVAVIDAGHRVFLNYEVFYFASDELRQKFLADPIAYCGQLTDPVTLLRFQPTASSPRRDYRGRIYLFPAEESAAEFDADPHRYAVPVYKMM
jgi:Uncharacterized conserved protein